MKEKMMRWLPTVALCILLVVCLVRIHELERQLERETGYLQSQIQSLEGTISNIYSNVDEQLEKEASQLADSGWELSNVDVDARKAVVECSVTPKVYENGVTRAFLICNGQEYEMKMKQGTFTAEIEAELFEVTAVSQVLLKDGERIRTEYLDWNINPREMLLPDMHASLNGTRSFGPMGKNYNTLNCDGEIEIHIDSKGDRTEIRSMKLLKVLDGEVLESRSVPADEDGQYMIAMKEKSEVPFGRRFELVAEAVDQYGLVYRTIVHRWDSDAEGQPVDNMDWFGYGASIYDGSGKLLYPPEF